MSLLDGTYEYIRHEHFDTYLENLGVPKEHVNAIMKCVHVIVVSRNGDNINIRSLNLCPHSTTFILNQEIDEVLKDKTIKSKATLNGNILTIESRSLQTDSNICGKEIKRIMEFTENELICTLIPHNADGTVAKKYYIRRS